MGDSIIIHDSLRWKIREGGGGTRFKSVTSRKKISMKYFCIIKGTLMQI